MQFGLEDAGGHDLNNEKHRLMREADEAFKAHDRPRCVDAITRLYELFDRHRVSVFLCHGLSFGRAAG